MRCQLPLGKAKGLARHSRLGKIRNLRHLQTSWRGHQESNLASQVPSLSQSKERRQCHSVTSGGTWSPILSQAALR